MDTYAPNYTHSLSHPKYRPDIDGLRAIAVLSVVFFHAFPDILRGGYVGVDIFFVISGFLISTIIFKSLQTNSFSFIDFFSRRVRRIFPALFIVMTVSFITGWFVLSADEFRMLGKHMVGGAAFIYNILLWRESGYFDNDADTKILLHLWSLGIEEQFYIIWPFMLWAAWKKKINIFVMLISFVTISFLLNIGGIKANPVATFFLPQTRFWELLVGAFLAYMMLFKNEALERMRIGNGSAQSLIGLLLIIGSIFIVTKEVMFPGWWALMPVVGAAMIIFSGPTAWVNRKILSARPVVWIGLISFPIYLWHWPLLAFARILEGDLPALWLRILFVVVSILLAWGTYQLIEKPLRFGKHPKRNTLILAGAMGIVLCVGAVTFVKNGFPSRAAARPFVDFIYDTSSLGYKTCASETMLGKMGLTYCLTNTNRNGPVNAVIIGDSHADDKFNGITKLDISRNWMLIGHKSCPPVYGVNVIIYEDDCQQKSEKIIDWVIANKDIRIVALSFFGHYEDTVAYNADHKRAKDVIRNSKITKEGMSGETRFELLSEGLNATIQKLLAAGKKVIIFIDIPELPYFPKDCIRKDSLCEMGIEKVEQRQQHHIDMIMALKKTNPTLQVFDPTSIFCNSNVCSFKNGDTIMYRDSHHLSLKGSDIYAKRFLEWLKNRHNINYLSLTI